MEPDQDTGDRDLALRAMLVDQVTPPAANAPLRPAPSRLWSGLVTAVVLVLVVVLTVIVVRFGTDRSAPADGSFPLSTRPVPELTIPAGKVLGRYSSVDGPNQTHVIHPNGLAIATAYVCTGEGSYFFGVTHDGDESGSPSCTGSGGGSGNKGVSGDTTVKIRTAKGMRWEFVVVGIPETYVTPRPIPTPTDASGSPVRYCTADDLSARFLPRSMPKGVTAVSGGDLEFTNRSRTSCALAGYPEVRFLQGTKPLGHNTMNHIDERSSTEHGLRAVVLRPGGPAWSQVDWYLPNANAKEEGACRALPVTGVRVDLQYDLAAPGQTGAIDVPIGRATACLNGAHGALGKYGQISSSVFVDYPNTGKR